MTKPIDFDEYYKPGALGSFARLFMPTAQTACDAEQLRKVFAVTDDEAKAISSNTGHRILFNKSQPQR